MELHCAQYLLDTLAGLGIDTVLDQHPLGVRPIASDEVLIHPGVGPRPRTGPPPDLPR